MGKQWKQWKTLFSWAAKLLQMVTAAMKFKDACSCLQSFPASGSFPMGQFFASGGQSIAVSASASVSPSNEYSGTSFRMGWLDLLAVQGTLKSLLQHRSSKADITLQTKVHLVKAMVFSVVMYGCESWTIKKAECGRIDALWCWRRLLRVPWSARKSNQSIIKGISPEYSLEGLMLKLKLQYFGVQLSL